MNRRFRFAWLVGFVVLVSACRYEPPLPPAEALVQAMKGVLLDTGFYQEITAVRPLGNHYAPGDERWTLYACFDFVTRDNLTGSNCADTFQAVKLDTGTWVISVTILDAYRWRAVNFVDNKIDTEVGRPADTPPNPRS